MIFIKTSNTSSCEHKILRSMFVRRRWVQKPGLLVHKTNEGSRYSKCQICTETYACKQSDFNARPMLETYKRQLLGDPWLSAMSGDPDL